MTVSIDDADNPAKDNTINVNLSNYSKVGHRHNMIDINELISTLGGKTNIGHTHVITDIKDLNDTLISKSNVGHTHTYSAITDINSLPQLNSVNLTTFTINEKYSVQVDDSGDLRIFFLSNVIAHFVSGTYHWYIDGIDLNQFITDTNATLENHYNAIQLIMQNLGISS
jgi:hypothetical protein